ncbi:MAG: amidase [Actinomycetota bacterium]
MDLPMTIEDAAAGLRSGVTSSRELVELYISRADALDEQLGCYISRFDESAREAADVADAELAAGTDRGVLHGIPLGIKDIIATDDGPTTGQSLVLPSEWGDQGDGPVMKRLRGAGAIMMGKTTTMEFACGAPDPEKPFPIPRNPWNLAKTPGGSSSGTGNGVAAGLFAAGLGTDTGGSVRWPAAACGITGMKQTFGRVPKSGCLPLGFTYDNIGPMARSAWDCAAMLQVMAGPDPSDMTTAEVEVGDYLSTIGDGVAGMKIGVDRANTIAQAGVTADAAAVFEASLDVLATAGAEIIEIEIPHYQALVDADIIGLFAEAYSWHRHYLQTKWGDYGRPTRQALISGAFISGGDYVQAQRVREYGRMLVQEMLGDLDLIATPTVVAGAPDVDGLSLADIFPDIHTPVFNATGHPSIALPIGYDDSSMPLSLQLTGAYFDEATVFRAAHAYQQATTWHLDLPPLAQI